MCISMENGVRTGWQSAVRAGVKAADVDVVAHIPDTMTTELIDSFEDDADVDSVLVTREEEAVGVLSGAWLGGRRGALVCQSSGLANTFNALASLSIPARIPFLGIVTRRGDLGEFNLAQVPAGYNLPRILDDMGIRNRTLGAEDDIEQVVTMAGMSAFETQTPYILLLDSTVTGYKSEGAE